MKPSFLQRAALFPILLASTVTLTACESHFTDTLPPDDFGGGPFPGPPPGPGQAPTTGRDFFLSAVGPGLQQSCASCHARAPSGAKSGAPLFLGDTPQASYVTLVLFGGMISFPEDSILTHYGNHAGPDVTAEQRQLIDSWLKLEMNDRGVMKDFAMTLEDALPMIGTCMSQQDWTDDGLDELSVLKTDASAACSDCHTDGTGGAFVSADPKQTFQQNRQFPFINRWVRGEINANFAFQGWKSADGFVKTASSACDPASFKCHPSFTLPQGLTDGINKFVQSTLFRWTGVPCNLP